MSLLQKFFPFLQSKGSKIPMSMLYAYDSGLAPTPDWKYKEYSEEGYADNAIAYSCIVQISKAVKGVRWLAFQGDPELKGDKAKLILDSNHDLVKLLRNPNPIMSWPTLMATWTGYYYISGNSFLWRNGPSKGSPPRELWPLRPDRVEPVPGSSYNPISHFILKHESDHSKDEVLRPDSKDRNGNPLHVVLHTKMFNPLGSLYGLSPMRPAAYSIDYANLATRHNLGLLLNGGRVSGAFIADSEEFDEDQAKETRKEINSIYAGPTNAGKIALLYGGLDWKEMGVRPKDLDWLEGDLRSTRKICSVMGVPPELIGDHQNKTYGTPKEARKAFYMQTVLPLLDELKDELNRWLTPLYPDRDIYLDYDKDQIESIREERQTVWMNADRAVVDGWITPNEGRNMVGLPRHEGDPEADKLRKKDPKAPFDSSNRPEAPSTDPNNNRNKPKPQKDVDNENED